MGRHFSSGYFSRIYFYSFAPNYKILLNLEEWWITKYFREVCLFIQETLCYQVKKDLKIHTNLENKFCKSLTFCTCQLQNFIHGPVSDPQCKLNNSSFFTLANPLDYLICAKDIIIILMLLQMMGNRKVGNGSFILGFGWGYRGLVSHLFNFFVLLLSCY